MIIKFDIQTGPRQSPNEVFITKHWTWDEWMTFLNTTFQFEGQTYRILDNLRIERNGRTRLGPTGEILVSIGYGYTLLDRHERGIIYDYLENGGALCR